MSSVMTAASMPVEETEAYGALLSQIGKRGGQVPADVLVRHTLECVPAHEWSARVEALDAVLRRLESARKEKLRVESRPADGRVLGLYVTRRPGSGSRPYQTIVRGADPIEGRCDCPDFVKNSLGTCKHVMTVIDHLHGRPRLLRQALKEREWRDPSPAGGMMWDPIRPLEGPGDWLDRVAWVAPGGSAKSRANPEPIATRWFRPATDGRQVLKNTYWGNAARRLELVQDLIKLISSSAAGAEQDPALRVLLEREKKRLGPLVDHSLSPAELRKALKGMKRPLYPYQREGVERFLAAGHLLLADDMGLGKTAQAIACCDILERTGRIRRGLIIAPASLKPQWAREWGVFSDLPIHVVDGSPEDRQAAYKCRREGFLIINYEQLIRDLEMVKEWDPDLVVLDEAQRIKNWATKTALSVKGLAPTYRLVLTGTPMENRIDELASIVEWVDDMALEPKWRLSTLHSIRADGRREVVGARNLDTIRERLSHCMLRRVRQDVLDQLPSRTDTRVPVELTEAQREEHAALDQPIAALVSISLKRPLTQPEFLRLMSLLTTQRIISNGLAQLQFESLWPTIRGRQPDDGLLKSLSAPKLSELRQLVRQIVLEQGRRVVVFSQWRRMLSLAQWAVSDLLAEIGLRSGFFTGAEKQSRRTQNIAEFHDDPDFRILFTSDAGGVGLNLQRAANCVINLELPWNPAVLEQRIGRIYRLGQKLPIDVYNLVCEQGIESRIASLVASKQAFFKGLFDGDSDTVDFGQSSSFLAKVQKLYDASAIEASTTTGNVADEDAEIGDGLLDDEVCDPFEEMIEAGNESRDQPPPIASDQDADDVPIAAAVSDAGALATNSTRDATPGALPTAGDVHRWFGQLEVRRTKTGGVVIEAPAEAASTLGALFEGMARLMSAMERPQ
jgi:superfamily II DNA or RNA helicase